MVAIAVRVEHGVSLPDSAIAEGARPETVQMARKGSAQAAKLRWEMLRASEGGVKPAGGILDELEARRARRG
jgi:hypothetical protein